MDLPVFCSKKKAGQEGVCTTLNCLCSCPGSPNMGDYFWGAAIIEYNKSIYLAIKLTAMKEEVSTSVSENVSS